MISESCDIDVLTSWTEAPQPGPSLYLALRNTSWISSLFVLHFLLSFSILSLQGHCINTIRGQSSSSNHCNHDHSSVSVSLCSDDENQANEASQTGVVCVSVVYIHLCLRLNFVSLFVTHTVTHTHRVVSMKVSDSAVIHLIQHWAVVHSWFDSKDYWRSCNKMRLVSCVFFFTLWPTEPHFLLYYFFLK